MNDLRQPEFEDLDLVLEFGKNKHGSLNYMEPNGNKSSFNDMHMSMLRHLTKSFSGERLDEESELDHLLHLATRALMMYARLKRNIKHEDDK